MPEEVNLTPADKAYWDILSSSQRGVILSFNHHLPRENGTQEFVVVSVNNHRVLLRQRGSSDTPDWAVKVSDGNIALYRGLSKLNIEKECEIQTFSVVGHTETVVGV